LTRSASCQPGPCLERGHICRGGSLPRLVLAGGLWSGALGRPTTQLLSNRVDLRTVSGRLGHAEGTHDAAVLCLVRPSGRPARGCRCIRSARRPAEGRSSCAICFEKQPSINGDAGLMDGGRSACSRGESGLPVSAGLPNRVYGRATSGGVPPTRHYRPSPRSLNSTVLLSSHRMSRNPVTIEQASQRSDRLWLTETQTTEAGIWQYAPAPLLAESWLSSRDTV